MQKSPPGRAFYYQFVCGVSSMAAKVDLNKLRISSHFLIGKKKEKKVLANFFKKEKGSLLILSASWPYHLADLVSLWKVVSG